MKPRKIFVIRLHENQLVFEVRDGMINASRLGYPYGERKEPTVWLQTEEAAEIGAMITLVKRCKFDDLLRSETIEGQSAIWMDVGLALGYAGWLLPEFKQWCAEQVRILKEEMSLSADRREPEVHPLFGFGQSSDLPS